MNIIFEVVDRNKNHLLQYLRAQFLCHHFINTES
jgi:hypothetical protein